MQEKEGRKETNGSGGKDGRKGEREGMKGVKGRRSKEGWEEMRQKEEKEIKGWKSINRVKQGGGKEERTEVEGKEGKEETCLRICFSFSSCRK